MGLCRTRTLPKMRPQLKHSFESLGAREGAPGAAPARAHAPRVSDVALGPSTRAGSGSGRGGAARPATTLWPLDLLQRTPGGEPDHASGARARPLDRVG